MSLIELQAWLPSSDLSGAPDHTFATDDQLVDAGFNPVLWGEGDGFLEIHADDPDAQYLQRRGFIRAVRTDTDEGLFWWILEEGTVKLLSTRGKVEKVIHWDGRGMLYYLDRYKLGQAVWASGQPHRGSVDVRDYWTWIDQAMISILTRFMEEGQEDTRADFLDKLDYDFDRVQDSNGNSLTDLDLYQVPIRTGGLQLAADAMRQGNVLQVLPATPPLLQAFRALSEYRTDRSSGTFASGKVRFEAGVNIGTELPHKIVPLRERTHTLTRRQDGQYATEDVNGSGEPYMDFLEVPSTSDPDAVEAVVAQSHLNRQKQSAIAVIRHIIGPGGASGADGYFPSPAGDYWLGDLVTVHVGTNEYDLNEQALEVAGIRYFLRGADWMIEAQLGAQVINAAGAPVNIPSSGSTVPGGPRIELCQAGASVGEGGEACYDGEDGDHTETVPAHLSQSAFVTPAWSLKGSGVGAGQYYWRFATSGNYAYFPTDSSNNQHYSLGAASPGDVIGFVFQHQYTGAFASTHEFIFRVEWLSDDYDGSARTVVGTSDYTATCTSAITEHTFSATAPASTVAFRIRSGGVLSEGWNMYSLCVLTDAAVYDGDGPESLVGTSVRAARCDHNHLIETLLTAEGDSELVLKPNGDGGLEWGTVSASVADITDLPTAETDTALVLKPDGAGGVEWGADATGGGGDLDDLDDVVISAPSDGDVLTYDSGSGDWINAAPTGGSGGYVSGLRFAPLSSPTGTTNLGGTTNTGYATQIIVPTPMVFTHLRVRFVVSGGAGWRWGLFHGDLDSLTLVDEDTVTPSGSGTVLALAPGTERLFAAPNGPHNLDPGAYYLIYLQPGSGASQIAGSSGSKGDWLTHAATYTWSNTPDLTTGWAAYNNALWVSIVGEDAQARVFPT